MYIQPNMHLNDKDFGKDNGLVAYGDVKIDNRITVRGVKVVSFDQPDGSKKYAVLMPRRETKKADGSSEWKNVFDMSKEAKQELNEKVLNQVNELMRACIGLLDPEVSITVCQKGNFNFLGFADLSFGDFTVKDIRIYRKSDGDGIFLSYPATPKKEKGAKAGNGQRDDAVKWDSLITIDSASVNESITWAVERAYEQAVEKAGLGKNRGKQYE